MRVLVACEFSGIVRDEFIKRGHNAWSCDILPTEQPGPHIQEDVLGILTEGWDMMIAFPPCTHLCSSGARWFKYKKDLTKKAMYFVKRLMNAPIDKICIENPVGLISSWIRKPDQYIQPYEFGEDASKRTCLWLKNLPRLPTYVKDYVSPRIVYRDDRNNSWSNYWLPDRKKSYKRWANQTDSGQNKLGPSETRGMERSRTYLGIAKRMSETWG